MANTGASSPSAPRRLPAWRRILQTAINWAVLLAIVVGVGYFLRTRAHEKSTPTTEAEVPPARLSDKFPETLELAPKTAQAMHVQVAEVRPAPRNTPLKLYGSLYLEGSRLVHVQTRFSGQVVEVGETHEEGDSKARVLRPGDQVSKGQVLAKLWSREVGEKKSELVDAISNLYFHEAALKRYQDLVPSGGVPLKTLQEAESDYRKDKIKIESVKRTLRSWLIREEELAAIQSEAERIIQESLVKNSPRAAVAPSSANVPIQPMKPSEQLALDRTWAELDIVAPMSGVILEKNFTVGDIVDTSLDMFKIADLSRLGIMANVYEEDLPKIVALPPEDRRWEVELQAEPGFKPRQGKFESIGNVIDPTQHTAIVKGWLDNPDFQLRVGQFVTATIELPNRPGLVVVPISSLIDDGSRAFVFVARDRDKTIFTRREVRIARRGAVMAQLESHPRPDTANGSHPQPIEPGEWVVTSGVMELAGQYHTLETQHSAVAVETPGSPGPESSP